MNLYVENHLEYLVHLHVIWIWLRQTLVQAQIDMDILGKIEKFYLREILFIEEIFY